MPEKTIDDSVGTRERAAQRRRSRTYGSPGVGTLDGADKGGARPQGAAPISQQGDFMRAEPYQASRANMQGIQQGQHGEGAGSIETGTRGSLSAGLSGATTTRGGEQGGIGAGVVEGDPPALDRGRSMDTERVVERDLTVGDAYGGVMEQPGED